METINLKRTKIIAIIIILLVLFLQKCTNNKLSILEKEYNVLKEKYKNQKIFIDSLSFSRKKEKDSLEFQIKQREVYNEFLNNENISLKDNILKIKNKPINIPKDVESLVGYFNEKYEKENVIIENKIGLGQVTATNVVTDLENGNKAVLIVPIQDSVISNQEIIIKNLNSDKEDLNLIVFAAEKEIEERKKLEDLAEENIKNLEKQIKNQKIKTVIYTGAGIIGGILISNIK